MLTILSRVLALSLSFVAGCASATGTGGSSERNLITADRILATRATNAYAAIEMLRPDWLSSRGPTSVTDPTPTTATVYLNGSRAGGLDYLRGLPVDDIAEIRYFPAGQASARFGMGHPRGVIEVVTRGDAD